MIEQFIVCEVSAYDGKKEHWLAKLGGGLCSALSKIYVRIVDMPQFVNG